MAIAMNEDEFREVLGTVEGVKREAMGYRERYRHMRRLGYDPQRARRGAKSSCYTATSVYGSYDCPEVWTLRRFRDKKLATNFPGLLFIKLYYAISPALVKMLGSRNWFKVFWKKRLDKLVGILHRAGFSDKPYIDQEIKSWKERHMRTRKFETGRTKDGKGAFMLARRKSSLYTE